MQPDIGAPGNKPSRISTFSVAEPQKVGADCLTSS